MGRDFVFAKFDAFGSSSHCISRRFIWSIVYAFGNNVTVKCCECRGSAVSWRCGGGWEPEPDAGVIYVGMIRTQVNPAPMHGELRVPSRQATGLFRLYLRWRMRKHFHSLRVANAGRIPPQAQPLILFTNRASWWDSRTSMLLAQALLPEREHYAPMDSDELAHNSILRTMGFFGVENSTARGAVQLLNAGGQILRRRGSVLWVAPESQAQDVRKRPILFRPGLGALMGRSGRLTCVPIAVEYVYWENRLPEILVNVGEPLQIANGEMEEARTWTNLLSYAMAATLDELAMLATERDPDAFETILSGPHGSGPHGSGPRGSGPDGNGGISRLWKRITNTITGRAYDKDQPTLSDRTLSKRTRHDRSLRDR